MEHDIILQQPAQASALVLLFHGVGATAQSLQPLGEHLARWQPDAVVVSVQAPLRSEFAGGWQWFSVQGITPDNRPARVAQAMPVFVQTVQRWQARTGLAPAQTTLVGFSQGAIMSLAASQQPVGLAGRVVALSGRFDQAPQHGSPGMRFHLLHGQADSVVPAQSSIDAHAQLQALGASVTLDMVPGLGHSIDMAMLQRLQARLREDEAER
ncbi:phospholipase/carboxylesterase [Sphaerotilus natans subsp. natans DSM 6575]|jgi:phospholipase/carboxylesterase|uniref:Phospholipase/carboxylesterase n=1 Tax=Sphaerotilus natans subsp. natans DSM 6575 TaxID=1286631 RepID=A0A059KGD5_9BURK|nr:esterase [Sphaerotilus natans]KDB50299.1 phospholipase/carboxylesterase [Sphaerotilus natans subsp. natans DSM 6575]SIS09496.1 phospholipase/carboxylesterase [Sphaerotilus natans]